MRKLVLGVIALLALFSIIRAFPQQVDVGSPLKGVQLHPGLLEIGDGASSLSLAFGALERTGEDRSLWSLLPLRISWRTGDRSVTLGLNGLSFLLRAGVRVGKPVTIREPRKGDVISVGGKVTVESRVEGDVWAVGADVELLPKAEITGDVVTIGGRIFMDSRALVRGGVHPLPELKVPFLGVLSSGFSARAVQLARELLVYALLGFALFLSCHYLTPHARSLYQAVPGSWRQTLLSLALSIVVVPLLALLLVVSVIGIFLLPLLALALSLVSLDGFLALASRIGAWLRKGGAAEGGSLFLFTSGLLGLFLIKAPAFAGVLLGTIRSETAAKIADICAVVSLGLTVAGMLYGFGAVLAHARRRAAEGIRGVPLER